MLLCLVERKLHYQNKKLNLVRLDVIIKHKFSKECQGFLPIKVILRMYSKYLQKCNFIT